MGNVSSNRTHIFEISRCEVDGYQAEIVMIGRT